MIIFINLGAYDYPSRQFGGWKWSVADKVKVPTDLKAGPYLLSWRWDCEESVQVWQNCADVVLV